MSPSLQWSPAQADGQKLDDKPLVDWVRAGVKSPGTTPDFHTDGRLYLYSTLRPAADGALALRTMDERLLNVAVFGLVVLGGVLLLRAGLGRRALAVGALLVALVLAAVFCPTFSLQLLGGVLAAAVFVVLVIWTVAYLAWTLPAELAPCRLTASQRAPVMPTVEALASGLEAAAEAGRPLDAAPRRRRRPRRRSRKRKEGAMSRNCTSPESLRFPRISRRPASFSSCSPSSPDRCRRASPARRAARRKRGKSSCLSPT